LPGIISLPILTLYKRGKNKPQLNTLSKGLSCVHNCSTPVQGKSKDRASENQIIGDTDSRSASMLMKRLRLALRSRHYSSRTEQAYCLWVKRFICFHKTCIENNLSNKLLFLLVIQREIKCYQLGFIQVFNQHSAFLCGSI
jgi:hypothetical protein